MGRREVAWEPPQQLVDCVCGGGKIDGAAQGTGTAMRGAALVLQVRLHKLACLLCGAQLQGPEGSALQLF